MRCAMPVCKSRNVFRRLQWRCCGELRWRLRAAHVARFGATVVAARESGRGVARPGGARKELPPLARLARQRGCSPRSWEGSARPRGTSERGSVGRGSPSLEMNPALRRDRRTLLRRDLGGLKPSAQAAFGNPSASWSSASRTTVPAAWTRAVNFRSSLRLSIMASACFSRNCRDPAFSTA